MIMEQKLCATCVALAVFTFVMAIPQGSVLARNARGGGMDVRTADLCLITENKAADGWEDSGIGTVAAVTDRRFKLTAWAVSLEKLSGNTNYGVYNDGPADGAGEPADCLGDSVYRKPMTTDPEGYDFRNIDGPSPTPDVGDFVRVCRLDSGGWFNPLDNNNKELTLIAILEGVLVKGGKEKNKPGRCR